MADSLLQQMIAEEDRLVFDEIHRMCVTPVPEEDPDLSDLLKNIMAKKKEEVPLKLVVDPIADVDVTEVDAKRVAYIDQVASVFKVKFTGPLIFDRTGQSLTRGFVVRFFHALVPGFITEGVGYVYNLGQQSLCIHVQNGSVQQAGRRVTLKADLLYQFPLYRAIPAGRQYAFNPGQPKQEWIEVLHPRMPNIPPFDVTKLRV